MSSAVTNQRFSAKRTTASLPPAIRSTLDASRRVLSRFVLAQAVVQWSIAMLIAYWLFGLFDYLPAAFGSAESPKSVRAGMLVLLAAGTIFLLYQHIWKRWLVRWSDDAIALLIERKYPAFSSSLITTVQASKAHNNPPELEHPHRHGFLAIAQRQAQELLPNVEVAKLVQSRPLQIQLTILGAVLAASIVLATFFPAWTNHWNHRLFGLSDAPWPRAVVLGIEGIEFEVPSFTGSNASQRYLLNFHDSKMEVPTGQSGVLKSYAELDAKLVPELCTVYYRDEAGNRGRANMRRLSAIDHRQPFQLDGPPLEGLNQNLWLSIAGGDARISNLQLIPVQPPMISDLKLKINYPEYLKRSTQSRWGEEVLPYKTGMRIPQGSEVTLLVQSSKNITSCEYLCIRSDKSASEPKSVKVDLPESKSDIEISLGTLDANVLVEFRLWDTSGICSNRIQQFVLSTIVDQAPQVDMVLDGIGTAVTENVTIPIIGKVKDEYDVRNTWLEVVPGEQNPVRYEVLHTLDGQINYLIDLKEQKDVKRIATAPGSTIALTLAADDFYDLTSEPQVGKSSTVQLSVVTPDQLLLLLDRREAAMRKRLEQIIGEVTQLRDLLLNIERRNAGEEIDPQPTASDDTPIQESDSEKSERLLRIQLLRSQQAMSQISKSGSELTGVEKEIAQIAKELINNRIDSVDRRNRWQEKIQKPLHELLASSWGELSNRVQDLERRFARGAAAGQRTQSDSNSPQSTETADDSKSTNGETNANNVETHNQNETEASTTAQVNQVVVEAIKFNDDSISQLQAILANMLEIQDQTAIIDMLRDIIDNSNALIEKTKEYKKEQDKKALDFLK